MLRDVCDARYAQCAALQVESVIRTQKSGMVCDLVTLLGLQDRFRPRYRAMTIAARREKEAAAAAAAATPGALTWARGQSTWTMPHSTSQCAARV